MSKAGKMATAFKIIKNIPSKNTQNKKSDVEKCHKFEKGLKSVIGSILRNTFTKFQQ